MSAARDDTNVLGTIAAISARNADNDLVPVSIGKARNTTSVKTFFSGLSVLVVPDFITGYGNSSSPEDITVGTFTATGAGGVAPYTYAWTRTDAEPETWVINSPTAAATSMTAEAIDQFLGRNATFICTVTDANGNEADSNEVTARAKNLGGGLGPPL